MLHIRSAHPKWQLYPCMLLILSDTLSQQPESVHCRSVGGQYFYITAYKSFGIALLKLRQPFSEQLPILLIYFMPLHLIHLTFRYTTIYSILFQIASITFFKVQRTTV